MGTHFRSDPTRPFSKRHRTGGKNDEISSSDLQGNGYLKQITQVIAPAIASELNMNLGEVNKAVIGSSMGGLASLYAIGKRPDFFKACLALSPHWTAGNIPLVDALVDALPLPGHHQIWMSHGTKGLDQHYGPFQEHADRKMMDAGWHEGVDFITKVYKKSRHNERSWAKYLDQPMKFWLESSLRPASN